MWLTMQCMYVFIVYIKNLERKVHPYGLLCLSEAFWGARIGNFDIKPTDGAINELN